MIVGRTVGPLGDLGFSLRAPTEKIVIDVPEPVPDWIWKVGGGILAAGALILIVGLVASREKPDKLERLAKIRALMRS